MIHGIVGDVLGSVYEAYQWKNKDLDLILNSSIDMEKVTSFFKDPKWVRKAQSWTDDTLCTLALYNAYLNKVDPIESMVYFCKKYNNESIGFGRGFEKWLDNPKPYASYANGALMRIGFIPYINETLEEKLRIGREYTGISHNHYDCFKSVSSFIVISEKIKNGYNYKEVIKDYLVANNYNKTLEELHKEFKFEMNAMQTLLQACVVVLESNSFEDVLRNSFYVGGDSDTLACVACNLSSFVFEIPRELNEIAMNSLRPYDDLYELVNVFNN